jgi:uncharacterized membrane protein (DUF106 family)
MAVIETITTLMFGFYDVLFQPILALGAYAALGFFSAALAAIFSLIYWHFLDIEKANKIKEKLSDRQEKMKEARKNGESDEASEHMKKTMELNQSLMKLNMRPMIATMVFVALIFPWLGATFSPGISLDNVDNDTYTGKLNYAGQEADVTVHNLTNSTVIRVGDNEAEVGETVEALDIEWEIKRFGEKKDGFFSSSNGHVLKLSAKFVDLPFSIPFAGNTLNWLGFYILVAMPLTFIFRKALGVA